MSTIRDSALTRLGVGEEAAAAGVVEPTVWVVDDEPTVRELIERLLREHAIAVATFGTAGDFLANYVAERPGCLVLDLKLPDASGIELLEQIQQLGCTQPIIFISGFAEVEHAVKAMKMGVHDFLEKPFGNAAFVDTVVAALAADAQQRRDRAETESIERRISRLTRRELQVMEMVVRGMANKAIAAELQLSPKTVEVYRANVMSKMEATSLAQLVRSVIRHERGE